MPIISYHGVVLASPHTHLHPTCCNSVWGPSFACSPDHLDHQLHPHVHSGFHEQEKLKYQFATQISLPLSPPHTPPKVFKLWGGIWSPVHLTGFPSQVWGVSHLQWVTVATRKIKRASISLLTMFPSSPTAQLRLKKTNFIWKTGKWILTVRMAQRGQAAFSNQRQGKWDMQAFYHIPGKLFYHLI